MQSKLLPNPSIRLVAVPPGVRQAEGATDDVGRRYAAVESMSSPLEQLLVRLLHNDQDWPPPVCIVTDVIMGWAQDIVNKLKLPRFILCAPPAACLVLLLHLPDMISQGRLPYRQAERGDEELLNLPGISKKVLMTDIPPHLLLDPSAFVYRCFIRHSGRIPDAAGILLNTFYELEAEAIDAARAFLLPLSPVFRSKSEVMAKIEKQMVDRVIPIGPLLPSDFFDGSKSGFDSVRARGPEDHCCIQFLDKQSASSVVYISFGTLAELSDAQIHELALGLEASEQPFLWVLRRPSTTHESILPPGFLARTKGQGLVISWAPQLEVLTHASTGRFLSHCGWNSILESVCSGVALLGMPVESEQKMNCRFVMEELKVGLELCKGEDGVVGRKEVERVVRMAMGTDLGRAMHTRVQLLRNAARATIAKGGASHDNLRTFVEMVSPL